jgi:hypothetical protein
MRSVSCSKVQLSTRTVTVKAAEFKKSKAKDITPWIRFLVPSLMGCITILLVGILYG